MTYIQNSALKETTDADDARAGGWVAGWVGLWAAGGWEAGWVGVCLNPKPANLNLYVLQH